MDKIYVGDIPLEYHYADFNNNYIDLYNTETLRPNNTYYFYRVYLYNNLHEYEVLSRNTGSYYTSETLTEVVTTDQPQFRRDFPMIILTWFIYIIVAIWLLNLITSGFRKGGVLHGLL